MGRIRLPRRFIQHLLKIAVVSRNTGRSLQRQYFFNNAANAGIDGFHGFDSSLQHTCMPYHIGIGKIQDHYVILICVQQFQQLVRHQLRTHLRLQIIGCHLRRRDQDPILTGVRFFLATVKEKGHMSIFFSFGDPQLLKLPVGQHLAQGIRQSFRRKCHRRFDSFIILSHTDKLYRAGRLRTCKMRKILIYKSPGQLSGPVGTEIEKDHPITGFDAGFCFRRGYERHYEFISNTRCIRSAHAADRVGTDSSFMAHHSVIGFLHTFPAFIPVHGIVTSCHGCYLAYAKPLQLRFQLCQITIGSLRAHVTPV